MGEKEKVYIRANLSFSFRALNLQYYYTPLLVKAKQSSADADACYFNPIYYLIQRAGTYCRESAASVPLSHLLQLFPFVVC